MKKVSLLFALLLAVVMTIPASATNYVELRDQAVQLPTTYATHWAPWRWVNYQWYENSWTTIKWKADTDDYVQEAFQGWINVAARTNKLFASEVSSGQDVYFDDVLYLSTECGLIDRIGCVEVTAWVNNHQRDSSYWQWATVYVGPDLWESYTGDSGHKAAIYNLTGQLLGMNEQMDGGAWFNCNPDENSIMDGVRTSGGILLGCDASQPNSQDLLDFQLYWNGKHSAANLNYIFNGAGFDSPSNAVWYAWRDGFWNETFIEAHYYYWDGSRWLGFADPQTASLTGTHDSIEARSIQFNVNPASYGVPHGRTIVACAQADMTPSIDAGWSCGAQVWYP